MPDGGLTAIVQLDLEAALQHDLARTLDFIEGMMAFGAKRAPVFSGA